MFSANLSDYEMGRSRLRIRAVRRSLVSHSYQLRQWTVSSRQSSCDSQCGELRAVIESLCGVDDKEARDLEILWPRSLVSRTIAVMFSEIAQTALLGYLFSSEDVINAPLSIVGPLLPVVLLISWRIWRFSILPALYPQEPKEIPYWIPGEQQGR